MQWQTEWDNIFATLYGKKYTNIPNEIKQIFNPEFEITSFLVVIYAQVGMVVQKIAARLEVTEAPSHISPKSIIFKVSKLYWL